MYSFTATLRSREWSYERYTMPKPPSPTRSMISNSPRRQPRASAFAASAGGVASGGSRAAAPSSGVSVRSSSGGVAVIKKSALDHLHRFFQAAPHAVERRAQDSDLVLAA